MLDLKKRIMRNLFHSLLFPLLCSILLFLSVSLLFMFKEKDHEEDGKKDESYFLFFFFKKRWFVILASHVPYSVYFCSPLDFSLEHVFIPFDVEYRHSFPLRFTEDTNVMDILLLPQCIIMFHVPVCQRRITLEEGSHYIKSRTPS